MSANARGQSNGEEWGRRSAIPSLYYAAAQAGACEERERRLPTSCHVEAPVHRSRRHLRALRHARVLQSRRRAHTSRLVPLHLSGRGSGCPAAAPAAIHLRCPCRSRRRPCSVQASTSPPSLSACRGPGRHFAGDPEAICRAAAAGREARRRVGWGVCRRALQVHACPCTHSVPHAVAGARLGTLLARLPFIPAADAYVCEGGGRIFYPACPLDCPAAAPLAEDMAWRRMQAGAAGPPGQDVTPPEQRDGRLWEFFRHLKATAPLVHADAVSYTTAFRLKGPSDAVAAAIQGLPEGLATALNLGAADVFPATSGKVGCGRALGCRCAAPPSTVSCHSTQENAARHIMQRMSVTPEECAFLCGEGCVGKPAALPKHITRLPADAVQTTTTTWAWRTWCPGPTYRASRQSQWPRRCGAHRSASRLRAPRECLPPRSSCGSWSLSRWAAAEREQLVVKRRSTVLPRSVADL